MVKQVQTEEFNQILAESTLPVVCDFWATWCGPCKMLAPVMDKLSDAYEGRAVFVKVDVDENEELAVKYGIRSIPKVTVFEKGNIKISSLGFIPEDQMRQFLDQNV